MCDTFPVIRLNGIITAVINAGTDSVRILPVPRARLEGRQHANVNQRASCSVTGTIPASSDGKITSRNSRPATTAVRPAHDRQRNAGRRFNIRRIGTSSVRRIVILPAFPLAVVPTAVVVDLLFLVIFLSPLAGWCQGYAAAGALIYVGVLTSSLARVNWRGILLNLFGVYYRCDDAFSFSITEGIALGFILLRDEDWYRTSA